MLSHVVKISGRSGVLRRSYATFPQIPVLPPNSSKPERKDGDATPPLLPPDLSTAARSKLPVGGPSQTPEAKQVPFATEPILLNDEPAAPRKTHKLRNTLLTTIIGGALLFAGGVYGSLQDDTIYELFTEFVPYGEEAVLYVQEQEFRQRYPLAQKHVSKASGRSTSPNVYIPQSGVTPKIREEPAKHTEAKILQTGPQNSAIKREDKATPGNATHVPEVNKTDAIQQDVKSNANKSEGMDKTGKLPDRSAPQSALPPTSTENKKLDVSSKSSDPVVHATKPAPVEEPAARVTSPSVEPVPPPSAPIKTFDIAKASDRSIERLQFAINGIIKAANEYGSSQFFQASLENAKDEVVLMNKQIAEVQSREQLKAEEKLTKQAQEYTALQQKQIAEMNAQIGEYERHLGSQLDEEKARLNQAYSERLSEEVKRIESLVEKKFENELINQAIELQKKLKREIKSRVEEERGGRYGKLENLQKSIAELKQLNVDSSSFIDERVKLQELEVALNALKNVLHEPVPRPFVKELAAVKEIAGSDELLRATIDTIHRESFETGVPTSGQLADRFRSVAEEVRKASLLPEGAGVAGHATSWLLSKVMFRKRGMVPGSDIEAVLARTEAHLEANDLDSALREMNTLDGWAHLIAGDWLKMARRYLELQQSIDLMENSAILRALKAQ